MTTARRLISVFLTTLLSATLALAAGGGGGGGGAGGGDSAQSQPQIDPEFAAAVTAIEAKKYDQAIPLLTSYIGRAPQDAYAENWLAYSYRKSGQLDLAFLHYDKALKIDPEHRGAHSYLGEAYLMANNLPKAEEHLKILDRLCFLPCTEYTALNKAVQSYKATGKVDPTAK